MTTPRRVALATYSRAPELAPDDRSVVPALAEQGITADAAVWTSEDVPWETYDAVIIRSCWDYHLRAGEFQRWLARLQTARVPVMNSAALVRWNADKRYLLDLSQRGIATIPTVVVSQGNGADVESIALAEGWQRFVMKPAVSASGYETHALRVPLDAHDRHVVERVTSIADVLLQPFADEVPQHGEYSLVFIDGAFSHATLKRASSGEFRVQAEHGGSVEAITAPQTLLDQAAIVLRALPEVPLYARIDGVARGDAFLLMELELIEPNLFFNFSDAGATRFAQAVGRRLHVR